jgi:putative transposase
MKKLEISLNKEELEFLYRFTKTGNRNSKEYERAYILLALDKGKGSKEIEDFYFVSRTTIWRVSSKYKDLGLESALKFEEHSRQPTKYKDKEEAEIVALACTKAPEGRSRWTIRLLMQKLRQEEGMKTINRETIRLMLKKNGVNLG